MLTRIALTAFAGLTLSTGASAALITADGVSEANGLVDTVNSATIAGASDGNLFTGVFPTASIWFTESVPADYFNNGGTPPVLTFTFNSDVLLDGLMFWGQPFGGFNTPSAGTLEFRNDGSTIETVNFNPAADTSAAGESFDLQDDLGLSTDTVLVDEIVFNITDNHGGDRVGFSEIQFNQVPEPGSLALLAIGGLMIARRRRA